jgi:type II secretory pathway pseudopilin PulG
MSKANFIGSFLLMEMIWDIMKKLFVKNRIDIRQIKKTKSIGHDGYALVEIITSITILAIVVTAIGGAFLASYKGINAAGEKNSEIYQYQQVLESRIANNIGTSTLVEIDFPGYSYGPVNVQMKMTQAGSLTAFTSR